jgi:hypothetical protein
LMTITNFLTFSISDGPTFKLTIETLLLEKIALILPIRPK